jgi:tetratricopeptide (TPR) repeat protein
MGTTVETLAPISAETSASSPLPAPSLKGPWVYSAWLDLLVGCGGWSAPLLLAVALVTPSHGHAWAVAFYALAIVFNYPHFMATEYRAYRTRDDFTKYKFFTLHLTLLLALTGIFAHVFPRLVPWIFTLYICWSPWHYTGQNYGLLLMFVRRSGAKLDAPERRWLRAAFVASYIMLLASFETGGSNDPLVLSLSLPAKLTIPLRAALGLSFAICACAAFRRLLKRTGWRAMVAPLTLLLTQFLWFVLPTLIELWSPSQIPQTRYSSGILAVLHSAQYLWITSYYQQRDARAAGQSAWRMSGYWIALIAGGIALFIPGPWLVSYIFRFDFTTSFLIFTALVNIHHFMLDGAIWKLRDSRVASRLIGQSPTADASAQSSEAAVKAKIAPKMRTSVDTRAPSTFTRVTGSMAFRVGIVLLLFLWGGTDQIRFALGTDEGNVSALSRAASMNPYDGAVEQRIATVQTAQGKQADAIASFARAVELNPYSETAQQSLALALIQAGRYDDAYVAYQKMLVVFPHDADALLNYGTLAAQLGRADEAMDAWQRSLKADPTEINAHLYLAALFDQKQDYATASQHWFAYLQLAGEQNLASGTDRATGRIAAADEISALLQLSDDEARLNQPSAAMTGYRSAVTLAQKSGNPKLQSLAFAHLGDAQEKAGDAKGAADSFEKGLALDAKGGDAPSVASDWFNYAGFLQRHGKPDDLAYACMLQAEGLLKDDGKAASELKTIQTSRQALETKLGKSAENAEKNQARLTLSATSLPPSSF